MSKALRTIAGSVLLLLGASLAGCAGGGSVVTVNGQPISRAQFDTKLEASPFARQILQQMVQEALINQYAAQNSNIHVSDNDVLARESQLKANYPPDAWAQILASHGLTEDDLRQGLRTELILNQALQGGVHITNAQIVDFFNKNHAAFDTQAQVCASRILVPNMTAAQQVESLLRQHGTGDFASLAAQYSIAPGAKTNGGSLGCIQRGPMGPAFDHVAFSQPLGKVSQPVREQFGGFDIILVTSRTAAQKATLASARSRIMLALTQQQIGPLVPPFLSSLQQKAEIVVNDPIYAGLFPTAPPAQPAPATAAPAATHPAAPATH